MTSPCPSPADLRAWLADQLPEGPAAAVLDHVGACPACAAALEQLTGGASGPAPTADWDPLLRLRDLLPGRQTAAEPALDREALTLRPAPAPDSLPGEPPPAPGLPARVGRFVILAELGRGGMGVVYQAEDPRLHRLVAVKMILAGAHAGLEGWQRFLAEAEVVARLQHPNIVQIHELGEHDGHPFVALEYVPGGTLAERIAGQPQPPREAAALVQTLAGAVHYAHGQGVIHRDLKPANVLLGNPTPQPPPLSGEGGPEKKDRFGSGPPLPRLGGEGLGVRGYPKITDFGLAKRLDVSGGLTQTGVVVGTPAYMAPEQAEGRPDRIGPGVDVYALGAILYELLTGRPPFVGTVPLEVLGQVLRRDPVPPRQLRPAVPRDLETICLTCLAKAPARRYATAQNLAEDLGRFLAGAPIRARPVGRAEKAVKWARRHPAGAALAALLFLVAAVGFPGVTALWFQAATARDEKEQERVKAVAAQKAEEQERAKAVAAQKEEVVQKVAALKAQERAERSAHFSRVAQAHAQFQLNNVAGAEQLLDACDPRRRGWEWGYLQSLLHADLGTLPHQFWVTDLAFSPDGALLVTGGGHPGLGVGNAARDGELRLWEVATGRQRACLVAPQDRAGQVRQVAFSPDGSRVGARWQGRVRWWDAATGQPVPDGPALEATNPDVAVSPDGLLRAVRRDSLIEVTRIADGQVVRVLGGHGGRPLALAFGPDSQLLASGGADGTVRVWDLGAGGGQRVFRGHRGRVAAVRFHPHGRLLASGGEQPGEVKLWDLTREPEYTPLVVGSGCQAEAAAWPAGGGPFRLLDDSGRLSLREPWSGTVLEAPAFGRQIVPYYPTAMAAFAPDGRRLAHGDRNDPRKVHVADAATGAELVTLASTRGMVTSLAWDGAGQRLAWGGRGVAVRTPAEPQPPPAPGEARVVDGATGAVLADLTWPAAGVTRVALAGEGRLLVAAVAAGARAWIEVWDVPAAGGPKPQAVRYLLPDWARPVEALAVSPDGALVAAAALDGEVRIWAAAEGPASARKLSGPASVYDLAFQPGAPPGGPLLAGATRDLVVLWDLVSGEQVLQLRGAMPRTGDRAFNPRVWWSADGRRLAASQWSYTLSYWDGAEATTPAALAERRQAAAARAVAWHLAGAWRCLGRPAGVAFHLERVAALGPLTWSQTLERADLFLAQGDWARAGADLAAGLDPRPTGYNAQWYEAACLHLLAGRAEEYRRHCAALRAGLPRSFTCGGQFWAVQAECLAPDGAADPGTLPGQAREVLAAETGGMKGEAALGLALALYRAGHPAEAVRELTALRADGDPGLAARRDLVRALALDRLGQADAAQVALRQADAWLRTAPPSEPNRTPPPPGVLLPAWLEFQVLYRQAKQALDGHGP